MRNRLAPQGEADGPVADGTDVARSLDEPVMAASIEAYATAHGQSVGAVRDEAAKYLREMLASHSERATRTWNRFGAWMLRAHDVLVDEDELVRLRELDRGHSLALVFSHRSYLDGWVLPQALAQRGFSPTYTFGGANLDLPLLGAMASRTGIIFIRRATRELPVYRLALRGYIAQLVGRRSNLAWSIEGGRTRTGKLRPPVLGLLHYLCEAAEAAEAAEGGAAARPAAASGGSPDVMVVPVSIVYDQLHEVAGMTAEALGSRKRPEDLASLIRFARSQRNRLGRVYLSIGEPLPLRSRLAELRAQGTEESKIVERLALDVSHRINRATPVTTTAIVCLALLGADRALTFDRVLATVHPLAEYIAARHWPVAGAASLIDRSTIRRALHELVASGVLSCYDAGTEPVWRIAEHQHLVAAFYRNTTIHILVGRAIGEVALLAAEKAPDTVPQKADEQVPDDVARVELASRLAWEQALRLRELFKFEFFFPSRGAFQQELRDELALLTPADGSDLSSSTARSLLEGTNLHLAHVVLRPFLDAYLVVADRIAAAGQADIVDEEALLAEALRVGQQWELERRIVSAESVSLELFRTGLRVAAHRRLLRGDDDTARDRPSLAARRQDFVTELQTLAHQLDLIAALARAGADDARR